MTFNHKDIDGTYIPVVDQHFQDMLAANAKEPYVHAEYQRHQDMAKAAALLMCKGDANWAAALVDAFRDSNEPMTWYLSQYSRRYLLQNAGIVEPGAWVVGYNNAGSLPDPDNTRGYAEWDDAWRAVREEMEYYAQSDDASARDALPTDPEEARAHGYTVTDEGIDYGDDEPSMHADVRAVFAVDGPPSTPETDWGQSILTNNGTRVEFWIVFDADRIPTA